MHVAIKWQDTTLYGFNCLRQFGKKVILLTSVHIKLLGHLEVLLSKQYHLHV